MRVVLNALDVAELKTGVGHYTTQLYRCLRRQADGDRIESFPGPVVRHAYVAWRWLSRGRPCASAGPRAAARGSAPKGSLFRRAVRCFRKPGSAIRKGYFRAVCRVRKYDLYHEPNHVPLQGCDLPTVVTVHDLSVLLHPQWHPADRVAWYERHFERGLARCDHVLAVSEFTRQELIHHLGIPPDQVTRTYNGIRAGLGPLAEHEFAPVLTQLGLPREYLLYVGTIEPRKNVLTLLRAYCALPTAVRERFPLVLVGGWGWNVGEVGKYLEDEARHKGVRHLGYLPDTALPALYNGARALAYPSHYEGFGLPPVEMLACGGAVLASTASAVAETAGAKAHLTHPEDEIAWRDALMRVCIDDDWWQSLRNGAVDVAHSFTWERCASDTLRVYRAVAGSRLPQRVPA